MKPQNYRQIIEKAWNVMLHVFINHKLWSINNDDLLENQQVEQNIKVRKRIDNLLEFWDEIKAIDRQKTVLTESSTKNFIDN